MHAIKDKLYQTLSRFFSDSRTPREELNRPSEATSYETEGKSRSSLLPYVLHASWFGQSELPTDMNSGSSPSFKWESNGFSCKDKPMEKCQECVNHSETRDISKNPTEDGVINSSVGHVDNGEPGTSSCSDVFEDARTPVEKSMCHLTDESVFITQYLYEFFEASLPNIVKGCQWVLLYSTARHGISLQTLFRRSSSLSGPSLLITGDKQGAVFGALIDCPLKPAPKRKYQGTNQSFVFSTIYGEPRIFRPTGANRYFCLCMNDSIALGGGSNFALYLNEDLLSGTSGTCETFGNLCLANEQEFQVKNVEVWGFAHASPYLH